MKLRSLSEEELEIVKNQLGRAPRGAKGVVKTCPKSKPMVILTVPLLPEGVLFPTCFWLTCPLLNKKVSQLESEGQIEVFQCVLGSDSKLFNRMKKAHRDYQILRRSLVSKKKQELSSSEKKAIEKTGVAGTSDFTKIKCLHAHYAHFLATGNNPVGEAVHKKLGKLDCKKACPCPSSALPSGAGRQALSCGQPAYPPTLRRSELAGSRPARHYYYKNVAGRPARHYKFIFVAGRRRCGLD